MGRVVITANRGEGLYRCKLLYNMVPLDAEIAELQAKQAEYNALLFRAINTVSLLEDDVAVAASAKNAVIEQWKTQLISKLNPVPPVIPPPIENDPETGEPWVDPDRAQEEPLLALINAARALAGRAALSRDDDLDGAALTHLRNQAGTKSIGHFGAYQSKPEDRVRASGYYAESVTELLSYGTFSPENTFAEWQKDPEKVASLLLANITVAGVAYKYAPSHPHTHLWCLLMAVPGTGPQQGVTVEFPPDPAISSADETKATLEKIEPPRTDIEVPDKMGDAIKEYAIAVNKKLAAEREISRLYIEKVAREQRIEELEEIKEETQEEIDIWCCMFVDDLPIGGEFSTAEIPGFYDNFPVAKFTIMGQRNDPGGREPDINTVYYERPINIVPYTDSGKLRHSATLKPAMSFYDFSLEPGHLRWKPLYQYGTITAIVGDFCAITMAASTARKADPREPALSLVAAAQLSDVPIIYPPFNGLLFIAGDEVLVRFEGRDKTKPRVIGFRREPRTLSGRMSWAEA